MRVPKNDVSKHVVFLVHRRIPNPNRVSGSHGKSARGDGSPLSRLSEADIRQPQAGHQKGENPNWILSFLVRLTGFEPTTCPLLRIGRLRRIEVLRTWRSRVYIISNITKNKTPRMGASVFGTADGIRTHDLQSRSLALYPAELQPHMGALPKHYSKKETQSK